MNEINCGFWICEFGNEIFKSAISILKSKIGEAIFIATPLSYLMLKGLLDTAAYHMPLGPIPFMVTSGLIIFTAVLTIFSQVYKGASTNPVEYLRHE